MKIIALDSPHWHHAEASGALRDEISELIGNYAVEAAEKLSQSFEYLNIVIEPVDAEQTIPETGVMGMTYSSGYVSVTFDHDLPYGVDALKSALRSMIHHELVHAYTFAHNAWQPSAMFGAVSEGLASVFERDYAGGEPLWAQYESDETMCEWYWELKGLPESDVKDQRYFFDHPDGRKWIVYKTGAWMVDRLVARGVDLLELMSLPHEDIIKRFEELDESKTSS